MQWCRMPARRGADDDSRLGDLGEERLRRGPVTSMPVASVFPGDAFGN